MLFNIQGILTMKPKFVYDRIYNFLQIESVNLFAGLILQKMGLTFEKTHNS